VRALTRLALAALLTLVPAVVLGGVGALALIRLAAPQPAPSCVTACTGNGAGGAMFVATFALIAPLVWILMTAGACWLLGRRRAAAAYRERT
jgi:hypothetical protein